MTGDGPADLLAQLDGRPPVDLRRRRAGRLPLRPSAGARPAAEVPCHRLMPPHRSPPRRALRLLRRPGLVAAGGLRRRRPGLGRRAVPAPDAGPRSTSAATAGATASGCRSTAASVAPGPGRRGGRSSRTTTRGTTRDLDREPDDAGPRRLARAAPCEAYPRRGCGSRGTCRRSSVLPTTKNGATVARWRINPVDEVLRDPHAVPPRVPAVRVLDVGLLRHGQRPAHRRLPQHDPGHGDDPAAVAPRSSTAARSAARSSARPVPSPWSRSSRCRWRTTCAPSCRTSRRRPGRRPRSPPRPSPPAPSPSTTGATPRSPRPGTTSTTTPAARSSPGPRWARARAEYASSDAAVAATAGQALSYGGKIAFTQFSSSNGGYSAVGSQPYLARRPRRLGRRRGQPEPHVGDHGADLQDRGCLPVGRPPHPAADHEPHRPR